MQHGRSKALLVVPRFLLVEAALLAATCWRMLLQEGPFEPFLSQATLSRESLVPQKYWKFCSSALKEAVRDIITHAHCNLIKPGT